MVVARVYYKQEILACISVYEIDEAVLKARNRGRLADAVDYVAFSVVVRGISVAVQRERLRAVGERAEYAFVKDVEGVIYYRFVCIL